MKNILVLSIGNDILGDDGAAFEAADILEKQYGETVEFEKVYGGGLEILDFLESREKTLVLDTITTGENSPGTVFEIDKDEFANVSTSSPHYVGLPEVIKIASIFEIDFPTEIRILAIEIDLQENVVEGLSPVIKQKLPEFVAKAKLILDKWVSED